MNEWEEWLNDIDARGGLYESQNSLNGGDWEIDYGWQRNVVRNFLDDEEGEDENNEGDDEFDLPQTH